MKKFFLRIFLLLVGAWYFNQNVVHTRMVLPVGELPSESLLFIKEWDEEFTPRFCLEEELNPEICMEIGSIYGVEKWHWNGENHSWTILYYRIGFWGETELSEEDDIRGIQGILVSAPFPEYRKWEE